MRAIMMLPALRLRLTMRALIVTFIMVLIPVQAGGKEYQCGTYSGGCVKKEFLSGDVAHCKQAFSCEKAIFRKGATAHCGFATSCMEAQFMDGSIGHCNDKKACGQTKFRSGSLGYCNAKDACWLTGFQDGSGAFCTKEHSCSRGYFWSQEAVACRTAAGQWSCQGASWGYREAEKFWATQKIALRKKWNAALYDKFYSGCMTVWGMTFTKDKWPGSDWHEQCARKGQYLWGTMDHKVKECKAVCKLPQNKNVTDACNAACVKWDTCNHDCTLGPLFAVASGGKLHGDCQGKCYATYREKANGKEGGWADTNLVKKMQHTSIPGHGRRRSSDVVGDLSLPGPVEENDPNMPSSGCLRRTENAKEFCLSNCPLADKFYEHDNRHTCEFLKKATPDELIALIKKNLDLDFSDMSQEQYDLYVAKTGANCCTTKIELTELSATEWGNDEEVSPETGCMNRTKNHLSFCVDNCDLAERLWQDNHSNTCAFLGHSDPVDNVALIARTFDMDLSEATEEDYLEHVVGPGKKCCAMSMSYVEVAGDPWVAAAPARQSPSPLSPRRPSSATTTSLLATVVAVGPAVAWLATPY